MTSLAATKAKPVGDPLAFYGVAATIIPVLLIALVFQAKGFDLPEPQAPIVAPVVGSLVLAFAVVGEIAALKALSTRHPTHYEHLFAVVGLFTTGFAMLYFAISELVGHEGRIETQEERRPLAFVTLFVVIAAVIAVAAF